MTATTDRLRFLDDLGRATAKLVDASEILAVTTRMLGTHLGASICAYADMDEDEDGFTIRGDWSAPGSATIVGHYSLADFGQRAVANLTAGEPLVIANNLEEIAPHEAATFQSIGITATICMPLVKEGRLRALMAAHHKAPHNWTEDELALIREVTERSWAHVERVGTESALRDSEARLRLAIDHADIGLWDVDEVHQTLFWPPRVKAMFGISPQAPVTMEDFYNGLHQEDRDATAKAYLSAADPERRTLYDVEYRTLGKEDGVVRWVAAKGRGLFSDDGICLRVIGTAIDITGRKLAEARLLASEAALRELNETLERRVTEALAEKRLLAEIVDNTDALVQVIDTEFRWLAINKAAAREFERIFGVRPAVGLSMLETLAEKPEQQRELRALWSRALAGQTFTEIQEFGAPELDRRHYEATFNVLRGPDGRIAGAYQFVHDVTERLEQQTRLREAEQALQQVQKMDTVGQLTGGIAHDFNNLLQGVVGSFDLIAQKPEDPVRVKQWAEAGLMAAERGMKLTGQLLAFARSQKVVARPIVIGELLQGMHDLIRRTLGATYDVQLNVGPERARILADPVQMEMAVLNLAVNARDAMPGGGRLVITSRICEIGHDVELPPGRYACVEVTDEGAGIPPDILTKVFDPFFTTKPLGQGTGLGLSQVYGIAKQAGGAARIESRPGRGTTVRLYFPLTTAEEMPHTPGSDASIASSLANFKILLVDDDKDVRRFLEDGLDTLDISVTAASDGPSALSMLEFLEPDAIVLDYAMPGMNGAEVYAEIIRRRPDVPIVMMTGYADMAAIEAVAGPGLVILKKPFRVDELRQALGHLLEQRQSVGRELSRR